MKQIEIELIKGLVKNVGCDNCPIYGECKDGEEVCDVLYVKLRNYRKK